MLYEMLTGRHPFAGPTVSDTVVAVLGRDPDWAELSAGTPARVHWLVRRCLEKDPKRRLHDIADARIELDDALTGDSGSLPARGIEPALAGRRFARQRVAWIVAAICLIALIGALTAARRGLLAPPAPDSRMYRSSIVLPDQLRLTALDPAGRFALSPDGRLLALVASDAIGQSMLWIRPLDGLVAQPLAGTEGASFPFWSPDSRFVGFIARPGDPLAGSGSKLKRIEVAGGQTVTLCDTSFGATGAWNRDGVILFTPRGNTPLHRVSASGGTPSGVTTLDATSGDVQHSFPFFLPDGRRFVYSSVGTSAGSATDPGGVYVGSLEAGFPTKLLVEGASNAKYASGHLIFLRGGTLVAQPFDVARLELHGEPITLVEQVQIAGRAGGGNSGAFTVSDTGALAYQTSSLVRSQLAWFDRAGRQIAPLGDQADYEEVALSPDGSRAAVSILDPALGTRDLWIYDVARGLRERFTFDPSDDFAPVWSPDGRRLIFTSLRAGSINLFQRRVSDSGGDETLPADNLGLGKFAAHWSPDGRFLLYVAGGRIIARSDLWVMPLRGGGKPYPFLETSFVESQGRFSPDSQWIAFMSNTSELPEVYVTPFPGPGEKRRVSANGGAWPRWSGDGTEILYLAGGNQMMSAAVTSRGSELLVGDVTTLFTVRTRPSTRLDAYPYDVSPDGQRFLINTFVDDTKPGAITLVVNWAGALKK